MPGRGMPGGAMPGGGNPGRCGKPCGGPERSMPHGQIDQSAHTNPRATQQQRGASRSKTRARCNGPRRGAHSHARSVGLQSPQPGRPPRRKECSGRGGAGTTDEQTTQADGQTDAQRAHLASAAGRQAAGSCPAAACPAAAGRRLRARRPPDA
jgi:hypothetical protein